jgi:cobalt-zinc-cadmium efflux system membrane fusion protein
MRTGTRFALIPLLYLSCASSEPERDAENAGTSAIELTDRVVIPKSALESLRLTYARAEESTLTPALQVPAELTPDPDRRATVGSRVSGRVVQVHVVAGERVRRGTPLVDLESEDAGRARAEHVAAVARVDVARRAAERARSLLEGRVTSERAVEEADGALRILEAELRAVETRLATFGVPPVVEPGADPARVRVESPIDGTVVARTAYIGQWVEPSDVVVEVVDLDELWLRASVYEREMRHVRVGQVVQVGVRAYPGELFAGRVAQVSDVLDPETRSVPIRVVLPNRDRRLKPGMFATANIQGTHAHEPRRLLAIPAAAIQEVDGHRAVFVRLDEGVFELRQVHTGERAGDQIEILNGLSPGDEVVGEGSFLLKGALLKATLGEEE